MNQIIVQKRERRRREKVEKERENESERKSIGLVKGLDYWHAPNIPASPNLQERRKKNPPHHLKRPSEIGMVDEAGWSE